MSDSADTHLVLPEKLVLPLEFHLNMPFLMGRLDGRPCRMLLDSGAPGITLNAAHIPEDRLTKAGELMGASGKVASFRAHVKELRFESWCMGPLEVMALVEDDLEAAFGVKFDGLIGFRELIYYDWMVDYASSELTLWRHFAHREHELRAEVRVRYLNHLPLLDLEIAGHTFHLLLDTGASGIVFDKEKMHLLEDVLEDRKDDELQGAGGLKVAVSGGQLTRYSIGGIELEGAEIMFSDISSLSQRLGAFDGIIGYSLLSKVRVVVSWEQRRLYILA